MKLNKSSYVHISIRKMCLQLELLADMKMITDLSDDFTEIKFINKLGYILIDYRNEACFTLSHHLTKLEMSIIEDIMLYCNWLELGIRVNEMIKKGGK